MVEPNLSLLIKLYNDLLNVTIFIASYSVSILDRAGYLDGSRRLIMLFRRNGLRDLGKLIDLRHVV